MAANNDALKMDLYTYLLSAVIRNVLKVFWIFPVHSNKIFFMLGARNGYCDSEKYLTEYILKNYSGKFEIVWPQSDPAIIAHPEVTCFKPFSLRHFYHFCTAKVIVTNGGFPPYMPKKKSQYYINTWHGGGAYKKGTPATKYRARVNRYKSSKTNLFISSCKAFSELVIPYLTSGYKGEIMPCGLPRNDILFASDRSLIRKKVCETFGLDESKLLILYAPTYRGHYTTMARKGSIHDWTIDVETVREALRKRFGKEAIFLFRQHGSDESERMKSDIDAGAYKDMQELLSAVDVLITDYSSSIWDFSFTYRPCFQYVPDLDDYTEEWGFYTPIETWAGLMAQTNEELRDVILRFDEEEYRAKVDKHHRDLGSYETGMACERVCKRIAEVTGID